MIKKLSVIFAIVLLMLSIFLSGTAGAATPGTVSTVGTTTTAASGSNLAYNLSTLILGANSTAVDSLGMLEETSPQVTGYMPASQEASVLGGSFPALNQSYSQYPSATAMYQRSWSTGGISSSFAVIIGAEVQNDGLAGELLTQINSQNPLGGKAVSQTTFFDESIPEAEGFIQKVNESPSVTYYTWIITFLDSNVVFEVYLISPEKSFSQSQIEALAQAQYQQATYDIPAVTIPSTTLGPSTTALVTPQTQSSSSGSSILFIIIPIVVILLAGIGYFVRLKLNQRSRKRLWESRGLAHAMQVQNELTKTLNANPINDPSSINNPVQNQPNSKNES